MDDREMEVANALLASAIAKRYKQLTGDTSEERWIAVAVAGCQVLKLVDRDDFDFALLDEFFEFEDSMRGSA